MRNSLIDGKIFPKAALIPESKSEEQLKLLSSNHLLRLADSKKECIHLTEVSKTIDEEIKTAECDLIEHAISSIGRKAEEANSSLSSAEKEGVLKLKKRKQEYDSLRENLGGAW